MENKLSERIVVSVTPEQKRRIYELSAETGLGVGEWVRQTLLPDRDEETPEVKKRLDALEQRVADLEALKGKGK